MNSYTHICYESHHDLPGVGDCVLQIGIFGNIKIKRVVRCSSTHFTSWTGNYCYLALEDFMLWNSFNMSTQQKMFNSLNHVEELEEPIFLE